MPHPLLAVLLDAADGTFPPADGAVTMMPPDDAGTHAVVELTGRAYVLTDRASGDVVARGADGYGGASSPALKVWLAGDGGWIGSHDAVLAAPGLGGGRLPQRTDLADHPRVARAAHHRRDLRVHGDDAGFVTVGRGLVGRWETSVELLDVPGSRRQRGHGRRLIREARRLVPSGHVVFAQVAPGNAASLRAFLAAGFVPVGAETLIEPQHD